MKVTKPDFTKLENTINPFTANYLKRRSIDSFNLQKNVKRYVEEIQPHTCLYHSREVFDIVMSLSPTTLRAFIYVCYQLTPGSDIITFNNSLMEYELKISEQERIDMVKELCVKGILAKHVEFNNIYYINPTILFSGNRYQKFPKVIE